MVTRSLFHVDTRGTSRVRHSAGSILVAFLLFQVFVMRAPVHVRAVATIVACAGALRAASVRAVLGGSVPVLLWMGALTAVSAFTATSVIDAANGALALGLALLAMVYGAIWFYHRLGTARIRTTIRVLALRSRVRWIKTLGDVMAAFFNLLPDTETVLRGTLRAARIRGGHHPLRIRVAALRRALIVLASLPAQRARVLTVRTAPDTVDQERLFGRPAIPLGMVLLLVVMEAVRAWPVR